MRFVKPREISGVILSVVDEAERELKMVTPYVGIGKWTKVQNALKRAKNRGVSLHFYLREDERTDSRSAISELREFDAKISLVYRLHAKLYMSEKAAVLTSMNLIQGSDDGSTDLGVYTEDHEVLDEFRQFINGYLDPVAKVVEVSNEEPAAPGTSRVTGKKPHFHFGRLLAEIAPEASWRDGGTYWFSKDALRRGDVMIGDSLTWKLRKPVMDLDALVSHVTAMARELSGGDATVDIDEEHKKYTYIRVHAGSHDGMPFFAQLLERMRLELEDGLEA